MPNQPKAAEILHSAIECIDGRLGNGYAKTHPELIAAFMRVSAVNLGAAEIARAIESAANTISGVTTTPNKIQQLSALDMFTSHYADRLPPEAKQVLARLPDDVVELANDAWEAAEDEIGKHKVPSEDPTEDPTDTYHRVVVRAHELLRRRVPALDALSREDLDRVISLSTSSWLNRKHGLDKK